MGKRILRKKIENVVVIRQQPHFGLGLYIVRLIAEFHGGRAAAHNLPGGGGARFQVQLPRLS